MNPARPELIFVRGPQQGERAVMMTNSVLVGRSPSADVRLTEQTASREQVRFALSPEGWLMESLSDNGTRINGKNYKKKKKLILETGDTLAVGVDTEILYVAPGDDPEQAIADYRQAHAPKDAPAAKDASTTAVAPGAAKPQAKPASPKAPLAGAAAATVTDANAAKGDKDARAGKDAKAAKGAKDAKDSKDAKALQEAAEKEGEKEQIKGKKLKVILFTVVLVGMLLLGAAMAIKSLSSGQTSTVSTDLPRLNDRDIAEAMDADLPAKPPSPDKAAAALNKAVQSYTNKNLWSTGDLFRCVRDFKLFLAYKQTVGFPNPHAETMYEDAKKELTALVIRKYDVAWTFEQAHNWRQAKASFDELLQILPVGEVSKDDPKGRIKTKVIENVILHINFVRENMGRVKEY